jgi:hypothetical protein
MEVGQRRRVTALDRISDLSVHRFDLGPDIARHR